jgi:hypothetical protein
VGGWRSQGYLLAGNVLERSMTAIDVVNEEVAAEWTCQDGAPLAGCARPCSVSAHPQDLAVLVVPELGRNHEVGAGFRIRNRRWHVPARPFGG